MQFPRAYANGTWTVPSHGSLFTGRLPSEHGAHFALDGTHKSGPGSGPLSHWTLCITGNGLQTLEAMTGHVGQTREIRPSLREFEAMLKDEEKVCVPA